MKYGQRQYSRKILLVSVNNPLNAPSCYWNGLEAGTLKIVRKAPQLQKTHTILRSTLPHCFWQREVSSNSLKAQHHFGYPEPSSQISLTSFSIYLCLKTPQQAVEFNLKIILQWIGWILTLPHNDKDQKLTLKNGCYNTKNIRGQWNYLSYILISIQKNPWTSFCTESLLRAEKPFHSVSYHSALQLLWFYHIHFEKGQPAVHNGFKTGVLMIPWYLFL